jgi:hypothetical protein
MQRRADDYAEGPQGRLDGNFQPNQIRDVEHAFLTSQKACEETEAKCIALHNELVEERTAKAAMKQSTTELQETLKRSEYLNERETALEKSILTYLNSIVEKGGASDAAKDWTEKSLRANTRPRKAIDEVTEENSILRHDLSLAHDYQIAEAAKHSTELDDLHREVHKANTEVLENALIMRDLKQANVLLRRTYKEVMVLQAEQDGLEQKLTLKVIRPIELELWNKHNTWTGELMIEVTGLTTTVTDQEIHIDQQGWALFEAKERYARRFPQAMKVFYARDCLLAIVNAAQDRFGAQLNAKPLVIDSTNVMMMLDDDERKEFLEFSFGISTSSQPELEAQHGISASSWLQIIRDVERLEHGSLAAGAAHHDTPTH